MIPRVERILWIQKIPHTMKRRGGRSFVVILTHMVCLIIRFTTVCSIGALGFLLAVSFVRYRTAWALGNMLEYPVWLIAGFLVPLTLLPSWVRPLSWALAPTWGVDAIREAAGGESPWPEIAAGAALGAAYVLVGVAVLESVLRSARRAGTLALA